MKKVGIITLNGYKNYGNRLQNYALQEAIKSLGFEVETIVIDNKSIRNSPIKRNPILSLNIPKKIARRVLMLNKQKYTEERTNNFKEFSKKHINETSYFISENESVAKLNEFEYFVTGSDQVWNPYYINGSPLYFLSFAPIEKRISYAASFGIAEIPEEFQSLYTKYLGEMSYLAVREQQGLEIIKKLTGREANVVVDPTMLLTKNDWRSIAKESDNRPSTPFLLTYFLGEIPKSTKNKIRKIAQDRNLEIVNLASLKDTNYYSADPSEFIDFIDSAEIFCTDSFHGVVFSVLLETPFIVFEREGRLPSMNSRIDTIVSRFNFQSRLAGNISKDEDICKIDFSHVESILTIEREKALSYLKEALK